MNDHGQRTSTFSLLPLNAALSALVCILLGVQLSLERARAEPASRTIPAPSVSVTILPSVDLDRVTYYNAVEAQTDADPHISACGPNRDNQVAVSRDLFRSSLHCGDEVDVWLESGYLGRFVVWDTMNARFTRTLDILTEGSYDWGKTTGHLIVVQ